MKLEHARDQHKLEVLSFLKKNVAKIEWEIRLPPHGTGQETYFANNNRQSFFIKLGAQTERYQVMSELGLAPQVIIVGRLHDGTSILVQAQITGQKPTRKDFHCYLAQFAESIRKIHHSENLKQLLPKRSSHQHKEMGLEVLAALEKRWEKHKTKVPASRAYVDQKIQYLKNQVSQFEEGGLVASHNDICNGNWLVSAADQKIIFVRL